MEAKMTVAEDRRDLLRAEFQRRHGHWGPVWEDLLSMDAEYFEAYLNLSSVPQKTGLLSPKVRELILVGVDASTTHLYEPGLRAHIRGALGHGATREEILEVFQLVSVLGIHAISLGFPVLIDEAKTAGKADELPTGPLDAKQSALKESFAKTRGYWNDFWEQVLLLDTPLFEAYGQFSSVPWRNGPLDAKVKEFIYIAIDAATTHMFEPGTRLHMKNAFAHGATVAEIVEVLELTSVLGIHTVTTGLPILIEELERHRRGDGQAGS
jgi:alkylhydroperoxidase/carboxymuconolactone decarboxylase family protein YurZ